MHIFHLCRADYFWKVLRLSLHIATLCNVERFVSLHCQKCICLYNSPLFPHPLSTFLKFPSQGPFLNIWLNPNDLCLHRTLINCRHYVEEESTKGPSRDVITRKKWAWRPNQNLVTQSVVCTPAAVASSGSLVEKQDLRPTSDLPSQSLHFNRMTCMHVTVCTDFEERRAVLLATRMANQDDWRDDQR